MKKRNIVEINAENDIKYKGPLSYRVIKIIAWVGILFIVASFFLKIAAGFISYEPLKKQVSTVRSSLVLIANMALPCFVLSTLFKILGNREELNIQILFFSCTSALVAFLSLFGYFHYAQRLTSFLGADIFTSIIKDVGYVNIFLDLLLFSLIYYFLTYVPKKFFQGKKIYVFRSFVAFPILYEVVSIVLKGLYGRGVLDIPVYLLSFFTTKSPSLFICFILLIIYVLQRRKYYRKMGGTNEQFEEYLKTNHNSLFFSIYTSVIFFLVACLDLGCLLILSFAAPNTAYLASVIVSWGLGEALTFIALIPIVMLTSYTRTHKNKTIDTVLPFVAMGVVAFVCIEGAFQLISFLLGA